AAEERSPHPVGHPRYGPAGLPSPDADDREPPGDVARRRPPPGADGDGLKPAEDLHPLAGQAGLELPGRRAPCPRLDPLAAEADVDAQAEAVGRRVAHERDAAPIRAAARWVQPRPRPRREP